MYIKPTHYESLHLLYDVQKLCGNIGDRKLCHLAYEQVWDENHNLADHIWKFSGFEINEIDETFKVKIAGKEFESSGLYGLFIPLNNDEENIEYFKWKLEIFKPSYHYMKKIKGYLNDLLVRFPPGSFVEHKLHEIISERIENEMH
jgi:hypothetical protein